MTLIAKANPDLIYRAIYTSPNLPFPSFLPSSNMSRDKSVETDVLYDYLLFTKLKPTKDWVLNLSRGVLGVFTLFSVLRPLYSVVLSIFFLKLFYFSIFVVAIELPTILFFIFFTMIAPFFSYFNYLFSLSSFFLLPLTLEVFSPFELAFSLRAFKLLFEALVFNIVFLLLVDVSTLALIELLIEFPKAEMLFEFLDEVELDFFSLVLSWEFEWLRLLLFAILAAFRII